MTEEFTKLPWSTPPPTTQEDTESSVAPRTRRRDQVLYVRVNLDEKKAIVAKAQTTRLSISRYLTRLALDNRPPPSEEERGKLEALIFFFRKTEGNLCRLRTVATRMRLFSSVPGVEEEFNAAIESLRGLNRELMKRL